VLSAKPLISAAIHRFEGQAMTYVPGAGPCYRCLFPSPPADGLVPNCAEAGVLGVLPGVMGVIQATEALKLIVGAGDLLVGRLLTYDALGLRFSEFKFTRRFDCAVFGDHPSIRAPADLPQLCSAEDIAAVTRVSASVFEKLLSQNAALAIIDVREPEEFAVSHLSGALNIPVKELEARISEIPTVERIAFVCRSGARSLTASGVAHRLGVEQVLHLEGGLLAWQREVDAAFEVAPVA